MKQVLCWKLVLSNDHWLPLSVSFLESLGPTHPFPQGLEDQRDAGKSSAVLQ